MHVCRLFCMLVRKIVRIALSVLIFCFVILPFGGIVGILSRYAANAGSMVCAASFVGLYMYGRRLDPGLRAYRGWFWLALAVTLLGLLQLIILLFL